MNLKAEARKPKELDCASLKIVVKTLATGFSDFDFSRISDFGFRI